MKISKIIGVCIVCINVSLIAQNFVERPRLTVCGPIGTSSGISELVTYFVQALCNKFDINIVSTRAGYTLTSSEKEIPSCVKDILYNHPNKSYGSIVIVFDLLVGNTLNIVNELPQDSLRIAYSMIEFSKVPLSMVKTLNNKFDICVVPDIYLKNVYEQSGVVIPIYVIPPFIGIDHFIMHPKKHHPGTPFVFGVMTTYEQRKNHDLLISAFVKEFKDSSDVILKMNGTMGWNNIYEKLVERKKKENLSQVYISRNVLTKQQSMDYLNSIDCFVFLSKGEGFSIVPREAMALGIPCIIANNTVLQTIANSGFVRSVPSNILCLAYHPSYNEDVGYQFNCKIDDVCAALRDVYDNYQVWLEKARQGLEWVKMYQDDRLIHSYLALLSPATLKLDRTNRIDGDCLITNSEQLCIKYDLFK